MSLGSIYPYQQDFIKSPIHGYICMYKYDLKYILRWCIDGRYRASS